MNRTQQTPHLLRPTTYRRLEVALVATLTFTAGIATMAAHPATLRTAVHAPVAQTHISMQHPSAATSDDWRPGRAINSIPSYVVMTLGETNTSPLQAAASAYDGQASRALPAREQQPGTSFYDWRPGRAINQVPAYLETLVGTWSQPGMATTWSVYHGQADQ